MWYDLTVLGPLIFPLRVSGMFFLRILCLVVNYLFDERGDFIHPVVSD